MNETVAKTPKQAAVPKPPAVTSAEFALTSVPQFWPMAMAMAMLEESKGTELYAKNLKFIEEEIKIHDELRPALATPNVVRLNLRTMLLREYGRPAGIPTLIDAPHAGHTAMIADYHKGQSLIETLLANGIRHIALTDWKPATEDMKDLDIDSYLAEMTVVIEDLGGRVNLVGLCQGGTTAAMIAARFPDKINSLVLAGSPIDAGAGNGPIKRGAEQSPMSFYQDLVGLGGGLMKGKYMLQGWKSMHPKQDYMRDHVDLYEHIEDPVYVTKTETFERWYENPIDLPGRWYLEVIQQLFKENRLVKGTFVGLGRRLDLKHIGCPVYLLAGESDDVTTKEQVFNAENYVGTSKNMIEKKLVPGGHVGLFMGSRSLTEDWPAIARWIASR